jgi:hypothetical protein
MADRDFEIGGSATFKQRYKEIEPDVYALAVAPMTVAEAPSNVQGPLADGATLGTTGLFPVAGLTGTTIKALAISSNGNLIVNVGAGTAAANNTATNVFVGPTNGSGSARAGIPMLPFCVDPGDSNADMALAMLGAPGVPRVGMQYSSTRITTNATTVVKAAPGTLHTVVVGKAGSGGNTVTIYDNTAGSGTIISVLTDVPIGSYRFDSGAATGITIVTATGTAPDMTVTYV